MATAGHFHFILIGTLVNNLFTLFQQFLFFEEVRHHFQFILSWFSHYIVPLVLALTIEPCLKCQHQILLTREFKFWLGAKGNNDVFNLLTFTGLFSSLHKLLCHHDMSQRCLAWPVNSQLKRFKILLPVGKMRHAS